jgi:hypothetical protein
MVITAVEIGANIPDSVILNKIGFFDFDYESESIVALDNSSPFLLHAEPYKRTINTIYIGINKAYPQLNIEARVSSADSGVVAKILIKDPHDSSIIDPYSFEGFVRNNTHRVNNLISGVIIPVYVMIECNGYNITTDDLSVTITDVA